MSSAASAAAAVARAPLPRTAPEGSDGGTYSAAVAALRSGVGARTLHVHQTPRVERGLRGAVEALAGSAGAHLSAARALAPRLPPAAAAALLPAVAVDAFLARLRANAYDPFAGGGLGPWIDARPHARIALHSKLIWATARNHY